MSPSALETLTVYLLRPRGHTLKIEISAIQITAFVILNFFTNLVGIILHRTLAQKVGHTQSYVSCIASTLIITSIMIGAVHSPKQTDLAFFFSILFGISHGQYYSSSNGYFCSLVLHRRRLPSSGDWIHFAVSYFCGSLPLYLLHWMKLLVSSKLDGLRSYFWTPWTWYYSYNPWEEGSLYWWKVLHCQWGKR